GGDEISVTALSGLLADDQHVLDAEVIAAAIDKTIQTTKGDILSATGASTPVRVGVGANDTVLTADSAQASGVKWATAGGGVDTSGTPVATDYARFTDADTIEGRDKAQMLGDINVADGADVTGSNPPQAHGHLTVTKTQVFTGNAPTSWTDLDLSATIGAQQTLVILSILYRENSQILGVRANGDTDEHYGSGASGASNFLTSTADIFRALIVTTDSAGIMEWKAAAATANTLIYVLAYIKVGV
ncbi:hypothetical protein LCGC14_2052510, partial [marine sediment metagenome]